MPDKQNKLITGKADIAKNPDPKIDEDFQGYPHGPANDKTIKPQTKLEKDAAGMGKKDGEKKNLKPGDRKSLDEQVPDGPANDFEEK